MIKEWIKSNKKKPIFKFVVLIFLIIFIRIGITTIDMIGNGGMEDTTEENTSFFENLFTEDEEGNKKPIFDIHIGWGNIVIFSGLAIALAVIERRKDKSNEEQPMIHDFNEEDNE